jgi:hypothetical protein
MALPLHADVERVLTRHSLGKYPVVAGEGLKQPLLNRLFYLLFVLIQLGCTKVKAKDKRQNAKDKNRMKRPAPVLSGSSSAKRKNLDVSRNF